MQNTKNKKQMDHSPGINCPVCNNLIPVSVEQIIKNNYVCCPICGLNINISKKKSDKALEMLKKINNK